jgi:hypothetical protein
MVDQPGSHGGGPPPLLSRERAIQTRRLVTAHEVVVRPTPLQVKQQLLVALSQRAMVSSQWPSTRAMTEMSTPSAAKFIASSIRSGGVFRSFRAVSRRALKRLPQARQINRWMSSVSPRTPFPASAWIFGSRMSTSRTVFRRLRSQRPGPFAFLLRFRRRLFDDLLPPQQDAQQQHDDEPGERFSDQGHGCSLRSNRIQTAASLLVEADLSSHWME